MSRLPNEPVPLALILPEDVMCPASPSTDKVPDIAAEPVKGNIPLTPVSSEPSPVNEPVNEPVTLVPATVPTLIKFEADIVPSTINVSKLGLYLKSTGSWSRSLVPAFSFNVTG